MNFTLSAPYPKSHVINGKTLVTYAIGELIKGDFLINFSDNVAGLQVIFRQL